jgi:TPP-dependent pyruvate/acetoin dehydrogenase alpha subunit
MRITKKKKLELFEKMVLIRQFERKIYEFATTGVVRGSVHLCIGEEAASAGTVMSMADQDYILPTHRGHGQGLAGGTEPRKLMAEIIGRETGVCQGRVGSMHFFDKENNNLGAQGILGAQFPIALGVAKAIKNKKLDSCVLCVFGDGTSNQGTFYESLNIAELWDLPIFYICINNLYGMGTHYSKTSNVSVSDKVGLFGIKKAVVDGNDAEEVYKSSVQLIDYVKKESKPAMIECRTYRWLGHSAFDNRPYRPKEEIKEWKKLDPIEGYRSKLLESGISSEVLEKIEKKVEETIKDAADFALNSSYPQFDETIIQ